MPPAPPPAPTEQVNLYTLLKNTPATGQDLSLTSLGSKGGLRYRFPTSLGGPGSIPFTVFMPYKRPKGLAGVRAIQNANELYANLPQPEFSIALPTVPSAVKTAYAATYKEIAVGQALGAVGDLVKSGTSSQQAAPPTMADRIISGATVVGNMYVPGFGPAVQAVQTASGGRIPTGGDSSAASEIGTAIGMNAAQGVLAGLQQSPEAANIVAGLADNPYTDQLFNNMAFRTHDFAYILMPKNEAESILIDNIISILKYAMHPRPTTIGFFDFPYEFQIVHSIQSTTFMLMPSVLEKLEVDYGSGTDSLKLFKRSSNGRSWPAKITLNMSFKEMVLLNRDHLQQDAVFASSEAAVPGGFNPTYRFRF